MLFAPLAQAGTITVTTSADNVPAPAGSLREAINNAAASGDTIVFAPGLAGQTIALGFDDPKVVGASPAAPFGPTGIVIDGKNLTIDGSAAKGLVISGGNTRRI